MLHPGRKPLERVQGEMRIAPVLVHAPEVFKTFSFSFYIGNFSTSYITGDK